MNAIEMLQSDHANVKNLFEQYDAAAAQASRKQDLADRIFHELEVHSRLEQEVFYPAVEAKLAAEGKDLVADSLEAHHTVDTLIAELRGLDPADSQYQEKFDELRESVEEHIGEEEDELLPEALEALGDEIDRLSTQMQKRKEQLMASVR
ncbi:MAG TPA: hemerythrin domain-containing protein [Alphaproteobacteria bacterium]|nr:hemerythrin domain-containing protein [Alphaproteobacteria bacterium]